MPAGAGVGGESVFVGSGEDCTDFLAGAETRVNELLFLQCFQGRGVGGKAVGLA